jgi:hypothetical protein
MKFHLKAFGKSGTNWSAFDEGNRLISCGLKAQVFVFIETLLAECTASFHRITEETITSWLTDRDKHLIGHPLS